MHRATKAGIVGFAAVSLLAALISCSHRPAGDSTAGTGTLSDSDCRARLEGARTIEIRRAVIALEKKYAVYSDGVRVGSVTGRVLPLFGDTFTMSSLNGTPLLSEKEVKRAFRFSIDRLALITDPNSGREIGFIAQNQWRDLFNWGIVFHVYDLNQNELGQARQQFSFFLKESSISGMDEGVLRPEYTVKELFRPFQKTYDISVSSGPHSVSAETAVLLACIEDAIWSAQHSKSPKRK